MKSVFFEGQTIRLLFSQTDLYEFSLCSNADSGLGLY